MYRAVCAHCDWRISRAAILRSARRCIRCGGALRACDSLETFAIEVTPRVILCVPVIAALVASVVTSPAVLVAAAAGSLAPCVALLWLLVPYFAPHESAETEPCVVCGYDLRPTRGRCPECGVVYPGGGSPAA